MAARIGDLIRPTVEAMGFGLVRVRFMGGGRPRLQVMAERGDGTMSVDDCAALSRALSALLDVEDPIRSEYVLEVSSPGIDRPLVRLEDFVRFAGHEARLELVRLLDGRKRFRGRLMGLEGDTVLLEDEGGVCHRLPFALIEEAKLVLTEALVSESLRREEAVRKRTGRAADQAAGSS